MATVLRNGMDASEETAMVTVSKLVPFTPSVIEHVFLSSSPEFVLISTRYPRRQLVAGERNGLAQYRTRISTRQCDVAILDSGKTELAE